MSLFHLLKSVDQPVCLFFVGVPAVGKSTYAKEIAEQFPDRFAVISTDDHIERLCAKAGLTYSQGFGTYVDQAQHSMDEDLNLALAAQRDVIWDQTNTSKKVRMKKLGKIPENYLKIAVYFDHTMLAEGELKRRLDARPGKNIPPTVMQSMLTSMTAPTRDEGFDQIFVR